MTIIRAARPASNFTIVANSVCLDKNLSMRALGLLIRLLCRPDNWSTNSETLAREFNCGREQMRSVLRELSDVGYMKLVKERKSDGTFMTTWYVFDEPQFQDEPKTTLPKSCRPAPENPYPGPLGAINKTELLSTDSNNTGEISPNGSESGDSTFQLTAPKSPQSTQVPHESIVALWAKHLPSARQPIKWHASRQTALRSRWREDEARQSLTWWDGFFQYIARIDFLMGRTSAQDRTPFVITIDWVLELKNFTKILEGVYER